MKTTLTAFVPAHKQTNPKYAPGQQVNPVNPLGFVDKTLGDYIRRKDGINKAFEAVKRECCGNPLRGCMDCPPPMKYTFEEWYLLSGWKDQHRVLSLDDADSAKYIMGVAWKAAQENV